MSSRKHFPLRSSNNTPKLINKLATPQNKSGCVKKTVTASKILGNNSANFSQVSGLCTTIIGSVVDPTHSQKYMQHELDMAYNKYMQNIYLKDLLSKIHQKTENAIDEQLVHREEIYQTILEDYTDKKEILDDISHVKNIASKIHTLELLDRVSTSITTTNVIENIKKLNHNLHIVCDKLVFENMKFISTDENYEKLQIMLQEISAILSEINETNDENFVELVKHISEIGEFVTKLKKNYEVAKNYQYMINNLVLREASNELCKTK